MSVRIRELRQKRGEVAEQMRKVLEKAESERRALTTEEQAAYEKGFAEQAELRQTIERLERQQELDHELATSVGGNGGVEDRSGRPAGSAPAPEADPRDTEEYRAAFRNFLRGGLGSLSAPEQRALTAGVDAQGGFTIAPTAFSTSLLKAVDDMVFIRSLATKLSVNAGQKLGQLTLVDDVEDPDWTSELATGGETDMSFGRREMEPHPLAKRVKFSNTLLRAPGIDIEALARQRLAYKYGTAQERCFLTGTGANQPLGVYTPHADGIPVSRDVSAGNTTTAITGDGLLAAKYALKTQYRNKARWMFHRDGILKISQMKDGDGQYIWQPGLQAGQPDRLLNLPVTESEFNPNTFTAASYVGILGDFSFYWIVDALQVRFQRLVELYAEKNQTAIIGRMETDGQPVMGEAFVRIKLAAA
jgi:HK97 family phage major capsid protein